MALQSVAVAVVARLQDQAAAVVLLVVEVVAAVAVAGALAQVAVPEVP
jgi:hypothetical protein